MPVHRNDLVAYLDRANLPSARQVCVDSFKDRFRSEQDTEPQPLVLVDFSFQNLKDSPTGLGHRDPLFGALVWFKIVITNTAGC